MARFSYVAKNAAGRVIKGTMDAANAQVVNERLREQGFWVVKIKQVRTQGATWWTRLQSVPLKALTIFSRQFALLLNAGLTLSDALDTLEMQTTHGTLKRIIHQLRIDTESGDPLYVAMRRFPRAFSRFFTAMVRAGEIGGALDAILSRMAVFFEKELELRHKIRSAMFYPVTVAVIATGITLFMLTYIVPQFAEFYADISGGTEQLPSLTQNLLYASDFLKMYGIQLGIGIVVFVILFYRFRKSKWGHRILDPIILYIPIIGPLSKKVGITRFARSFATLTRSGVPLLETLDVVAETADNWVIERSIEYIKERIREGEGLAAPMKRTKIFPPMVYNMVAVGENAGNLEEMLEKLSDFYDVEIDATVKGLASLIEPLMMIVIGVVVGIIVVGLYLPIFNLVNVIK